MSAAAEGIRETASTLLAIANRLDGIDANESADAMRSGTATQEQAQSYLDSLLEERGGAAAHRYGIDVSTPERGGTIYIDNGDGTRTYRYNGVVQVPLGFAVGADRDGVVEMRCTLSGWCMWEYEPEDNQLTTEQIAEQAIAHVAERHSPGMDVAGRSRTVEQ